MLQSFLVTTEKLGIIVDELSKLNIEGKSYVADVRDLTTLKQALHAAKQDFGRIDVLGFSPYAGPEKVNEVLPDMIRNGSDAVLFTTG